MWDFFYSGIKLSEKQKIRSSFTLTCPCPVCSQLNNPEELSVTSVKSGTLISLHNLYWFTYYTGFFNGLVYFPKQFRAHVKRLSRSAWILKCMEFLDYVNETDLNTAWNKYGESIKKTYQLH